MGLGAALTVDTLYALMGRFPASYMLLRIPLSALAIWSLQSNNDFKLIEQIQQKMN